MDQSEKVAYQYLSSCGFRDIVYEPDGNIPPDFLVNDSVAVEVRRLNQNEQTPAGPRGLEIRSGGSCWSITFPMGLQTQTASNFASCSS
jgi:hypothetical protein